MFSFNVTKESFEMRVECSLEDLENEIFISFILFMIPEEKLIVFK